MKLNHSLLLGTVMLMGFAGQAGAAPALKTGAWTFYLYPGPAQTSVTTRNFCFRSDRTWTSSTLTPTIPGRGRWAQDGGAISLYGTSGEAIQGAAFSAFGQTVGTALITGQYTKFNIATVPPTGSYGVFRAVYVRSSC